MKSTEAPKWLSVGLNSTLALAMLTGCAEGVIAGTIQEGNGNGGNSSEATEPIIPSGIPTSTETMVASLPEALAATPAEIEAFWGQCLNCEQIGIAKEDLYGLNLNGEEFMFAEHPTEEDTYGFVKREDQWIQAYGEINSDGTYKWYVPPAESEQVAQPDFILKYNPYNVDAEGNLILQHFPPNIEPFTELLILDKDSDLVGKFKNASPVEYKHPVEPIDISNPETFEFRSWEELISPAYLVEIEQKEKEGLLPSIPDNPAYVKQGYVNILFDKGPSNFLNNYGIECIYSLSNEYSYQDIAKRPFVVVEAYKTEYLGVEMVFVVKKWENQDRSNAFIADFIFDYINDTTKSILESSYNDSSRYATGGYFAKVSKRGDGCKAFIDQLAERNIESSNFCKYYYDHPEVFLPENVYTNWQKTGILDTRGTLPVAPIMSNSISK